MKEKLKAYVNDMNIFDIIFIVAFLVVLAICLFKAPLEIQGDDEAFYLSVAKRLTDGDIFIVDEWHGSQFAGFLIYPLVLFHKLLFGFDGIVLHFRYIYIFFQSLCAIVIYIRLREHKLFGIAAAIFFYIFNPYDIMALSYNVMGLMLVTLTGTLLATAKSNKAVFAGGVLFAGAVLCSPYLLGGYAIYSICVLVYAALRDKKIFRSWLMFTAGAVCVAVLFAILMLSRATISEIINAVPNLLTDPEHSTKPLLSTFFSYFLTIRNALPHGAVLFAVYLFSVFTAILDKERYKHKMFYITVSTAIAVIIIYGLLPEVTTNTYNHIIFPVALVGLTSYITTEHKNNKVFLFMFLGGITYSIAIFFSSNQHIYALSMASAAANTGSMILIGNAILETDRKERTNSVLCAVVLAFIAAQISLMVYIKINHNFASQTPNSELTQTIQEGPYKGIRVTPEREASYMQEYESLKPLMDKQGLVLYACDIVWYYYATPQLKMGAYSGWLSGYRDSTITRLNIFYGQYPDKIPDYIYIPSQQRWNLELFKSEIIDRYGYKLISNSGGNMIYER